MIIEWLPRAARDRRAQILYIARRSPSSAIDQDERIEARVDQLLQHPELGPPGRKKGTRELGVVKSPFIVVYRYKPRAKRIEILRVLHHAQQYP